MSASRAIDRQPTPPRADIAAAAREAGAAAPARQLPPAVTELAENAGMLFVFSQPSKLQFWMKNTEISLDMIFADSAGRVVGIVADAVPLLLTPRTPTPVALLPDRGGYVMAVGGQQRVTPVDRATRQRLRPDATVLYQPLPPTVGSWAEILPFHAGSSRSRCLTPIRRRTWRRARSWNGEVGRAD